MKGIGAWIVWPSDLALAAIYIWRHLDCLQERENSDIRGSISEADPSIKEINTSDGWVQGYKT